MRVVAGSLRGRQIAAPRGDATRPTSVRVREAVFSSLYSLSPTIFRGGRVLDAFAGSGALGIEALSRGCRSATFVEKDRAALDCLRTNVRSLGLAASARVVPGDSLALAARGALPGGPFALLLLDPPYRLDTRDVVALVGGLAARDLLELEALVVVEHSTGVAVEWPSEFRLVTRKRYGTTEVDIAVCERGVATS